MASEFTCCRQGSPITWREGTVRGPAFFAAAWGFPSGGFEPYLSGGSGWAVIR